MFGRRAGFPFPIIMTNDGPVALAPEGAQPVTFGPFSPGQLTAGLLQAGVATTGPRESGEVNCCRPMTPKERLEARKQQLEGERDGINKRLEETTAALKLLEEQPGLTLLLDAVLRA